MGINQQYNHSKDLITREEYEIIKLFNENKNIVIRKADKSNAFVIMNKNDYEDTIDTLISLVIRVNSSVYKRTHQTN